MKLLFAGIISLFIGQTALASNLLWLTTSSGDRVQVSGDEVQRVYFETQAAQGMSAGSILTNPDGTVTLYQPQMLLGLDASRYKISGNPESASGTCLRFGYLSSVDFQTVNNGSSQDIVVITRNGILNSIIAGEGQPSLALITCRTDPQ